MPEPDDITLLRQYASGDESAFTTLFERHVHLVYSAALRQSHNPSHAEEVTQAVFILLARKATSLSPKTVLSGWLYQAARLTTASLIKREIRRQRREQEVYMQTLTEPDTSVWEQISPLLDDAMGRLGEKDSNAIVLRFFENRTPQEVAVALKLNEVTARKRVSRALEKLRTFFAKRGVVLTTAIIAGTISGNSVQAAPVALANSATAIMLAKGTVASTSTLTLIKGTLRLMAWTKAKTAIAVGVGVLLVFGTASVTVKEIVSYRGEAWQRKNDVSILAGMPPQTRILSSLHSRDPAIDWWGGRNGKLLGLGVNSISIIQAAYDASLGRMIFSVPVPQGKYDFISTQTNGQQPALQEVVKNKFGLIGKHELIETNVYALTLRDRNVPGLNPNSDPAGQNYSRTSDTIQCVYAPMSKLVEFLENALGTPVVDRTGLSGNFDIYVKWDGTPEGLREATLKQLGLELVPNHEAVEFLVVEKAN